MRGEESLAFEGAKLGKENESVVKVAPLEVASFSREGSGLHLFLPVFLV